MKVQVRRVTAGHYVARAMGVKIRFLRQTVREWKTESSHSEIPVFTGVTKTSVVSQVNEYLQAKVQR